VEGIAVTRPALNPAHFPYVLRIADGSLLLAQRLSECCGHGPALEPDIALTNIALDLLGQSRLLLAHAGEIEGHGRDEDVLAYWRNESEFLNPSLCELPNGDFAFICLRAWMYVSWQSVLWESLMDSADKALAAIAEKSSKETRYHCEHLAAWVIRLGDGTPESNRRMQSAVDYLMPYTNELFVDDDFDRAAAESGIGPLASALQDDWKMWVGSLLREACLTNPDPNPFTSTGRRGQHTEAIGFVLAEMQSVARAHPGAKW
jgi:ring-1,2-phenylacetyl-CoA epoxidase subunit PaaC